MRGRTVQIKIFSATDWTAGVW